MAQFISLGPASGAAVLSGCNDIAISAATSAFVCVSVNVSLSI